MRKPREVDRYTNEDTARMQAIWTGIVLAVVAFGASYLYFSDRQTTAPRSASHIETPRMPGGATTGSGPVAR
jgi:hypothetical protein